MSTVTNSLNKVFFRQSATPEYSIASQDAGTVFYGTIIDGALLIDDSGDGTLLPGPFEALVPYQDGARVAFVLRGQRPMILTVEGGFQASDAYAGLTSQTQDNAELIAGSREILDAHTEHLGEVDQWVEDTNNLLEATDHIVEGLGAEVERTKITVAGAVNAALEAQTTADTAKSDAAQAKTDAAQAKTDAANKSAAAEAAAKAYALAEADAKAAAALATAKGDATSKAAAAEAAAKAAAALDAKSKADAAQAAAEAKAALAQAAADKAQADLANLQIGGRNLILAGGTPYNRGGTGWPKWNADSAEYSQTTAASSGAFTYGVVGIPDEDSVIQVEVCAPSEEFEGAVVHWQVARANYNVGDPVVLTTQWQRMVSKVLPGETVAGLRVLSNPEGQSETRLRLRRLKLERGNKATDWSPAPEDVDASIATVDGKAVAAQDTASGALHIANLATEFAEGLVDMSPTQPADPPVGQIWIPTNEQGQGTGVSRWNGEAWETVTNLVGLLIVPTEDGGQTLIGPDGVETTQVLADLIRTKVLYVEEAGVETLVVTGIPRENLADDINTVLGTAEDLGSRIVLDGQAGTLTIARNQDADSSALTALRLSATNLDFISAGEVAAYIDATRNQFFIRNAYVQDTLQIGEHQVRRLGQNNITVFQWVGV